VVVIGSQAVLATLPQAPFTARTSVEIDAYPGNAEEWEAQHGTEASEVVNALFGYRSTFHETHGFYIDGVDDSTASLPPDWRERQTVRVVDCYGRAVRIVTPELHDIVASKLCRLDPKDERFTTVLHDAGHLDLTMLEQRVRAINLPAAVRERAIRFLRSLQG